VYSEKMLQLYRDILIRDLSDCTDQNLEHFVVLAKALDTLSIHDDLNRIQCQTLVLGSEGDRVVGADAQRDIAAQLGCALHMYEPVYGHAVYDEALTICLFLAPAFAEQTERKVMLGTGGLADYYTGHRPWKESGAEHCGED